MGTGETAVLPAGEGIYAGDRPCTPEMDGDPQEPQCKNNMLVLGVAEFQVSRGTLAGKTKRQCPITAQRSDVDNHSDPQLGAEEEGM